LLNGQKLADRSRLNQGDVVQFNGAALSVAVESAFQPAKQQPKTVLQPFSIAATSSDSKDGSRSVKKRVEPAALPKTKIPQTARQTQSSSRDAPQANSMKTKIVSDLEQKKRDSSDQTASGVSHPKNSAGSEGNPKTELIDPMELLNEYKRHQKSDPKISLKNQTASRPFYIIAVAVFLAIVVVGIFFIYNKSQQSKVLRAETATPSQIETRTNALLPVAHRLQEPSVRPATERAASDEEKRETFEPKELQQRPVQKETEISQQVGSRNSDDSAREEERQKNLEPKEAQQRPVQKETEISQTIKSNEGEAFSETKLERAAVDYLIANDFQNALVVYQKLAAATDRPIYATMVRILERRMRSLCSGDMPCSSL